VKQKGVDAWTNFPLSSYITSEDELPLTFLPLSNNFRENLAQKRARNYWGVPNSWSILEISLRVLNIPKAPWARLHLLLLFRSHQPSRADVNRARHFGHVHWWSKSWALQWHLSNWHHTAFTTTKITYEKPTTQQAIQALETRARKTQLELSLQFSNSGASPTLRKIKQFFGIAYVHLGTNIIRPPTADARRAIGGTSGQTLTISRTTTVGSGNCTIGEEEKNKNARENPYKGGRCIHINARTNRREIKVTTLRLLPLVHPFSVYSQLIWGICRTMGDRASKELVSKTYTI